MELFQPPILGFELAPLHLNLLKESFDLFKRTIIERQRVNTLSGGGVVRILDAIVTAAIMSDINCPRADTIEERNSGSRPTT